MSESGEMSEFGYIMELLAKGKVSASAGGLGGGRLGLGSRLGTQGMRVSFDIRGVRAGGHELEARSALRTGTSQMYTMHCGRLFFMWKKGDSLS